MEVYKCLATDDEMFSSAMRPKPVSELGTCTINGKEMPILVSISSTETTEDNTGGIEGEDVDDAEERKLNYFWQMPHMENDHTDSLLAKGKDAKGKAVSNQLSKFKNWETYYFKPYGKAVIAALQKEHGVENVDVEEVQKALMKLHGWVKENKSELSVFGAAQYVGDGTLDLTMPGKSAKEVRAVSTLAFQIYSSECNFYVFRPACKPEKF